MMSSAHSGTSRPVSGTPIGRAQVTFKGGFKMTKGLKSGIKTPTNRPSSAMAHNVSGWDAPQQEHGAASRMLTSASLPKLGRPSSAAVGGVRHSHDEGELVSYSTLS